ncbi:hypothetical protein [Phytomonospora endophytica]|uniref:Uncharacterized protein n=1 Tax=Phytomonospora endophytica TaxID=714109 RepID=A0A841FK00_9ACTN|nr:hypothetical protein [Phytomonospora endophytica]MBB6036175.1 hypothetical protein [Phytomonospora endophytica]GIG67079.1 hypothetical protein Pen01_33740 [Phytomonospora endophytica]
MPRVACREAFTLLVPGVFAQKCDGVAVKSNGSLAGAALGRTDVDHSTESRQLLGDRQLPAFEIDIRPPQPSSFTSTQTTEGNQGPQHVLPIMLHALKKQRELRRGPHRNRRALTSPPPSIDSAGRPDHRV